VNGLKGKQERSGGRSEEIDKNNNEQQTITQQYLTTFRIAQSTTIDQLKEKACDFWVRIIHDIN